MSDDPDDFGDDGDATANAAISLVHSPVQRRLVLTAPGEPQVAEYVFCAQKKASISLEECHSCKRAIAPPDMTSGKNFFVCAVAPEVFERTKTLALSKLRGQTFVCAETDTTWSALASLLVGCALEAVPVVDAQGRPIGMVSKGDLLRFAGESGTATAGTIMTPIVAAQVLAEDATLSAAVSLLAKEGIDHVPVVSLSGKVTGMFSSRDAMVLLAASAGHLTAPPVASPEALEAAAAQERELPGWTSEPEPNQ